LIKKLYACRLRVYRIYSSFIAAPKPKSGKAATIRDAWDDKTKDAFNLQQWNLRASGIAVERVRDYDVVLPILNEAILG
jgi:hypothetical protein